MWKSAYVGVYQLLNWKMHGETLKFWTYMFLAVYVNYIIVMSVILIMQLT